VHFANAKTSFCQDNLNIHRQGVRTKPFRPPKQAVGRALRWPTTRQKHGSWLDLASRNRSPIVQCSTAAFPTNKPSSEGIDAGSTPQCSHTGKLALHNPNAVSNSGTFFTSSD